MSTQELAAGAWPHFPSSGAALPGMAARAQAGHPWRGKLRRPQLAGQRPPVCCLLCGASAGLVIFLGRLPAVQLPLRRRAPTLRPASPSAVAWMCSST